MFSGGYVHNLKYIFSEEDLANLLSKMGYAKRTGDQCFQVTHLPSMSQLMLAACGFFAARVECEILSDIISGLDAFKVSATHLIQERRKNIGGVDGCIERLQTLSLNMARLEPKKAYVFQPTSYDFDGDIYTAGSANQAQHPYLHSDSLIGRKELSFQPLFTANPELNTFYTALSNCHGVPGSDKARGNGKDIDQQVQYDTGLKKSFTPEQTDLGFNSPFKNVDEANSSKSTGCKSPVAEICVTLSRGAAYKLHDCVIDTACLGYRCDSCQILHENMCKEVAICRSKYHPLNYIFSDEKDEILAELICQRYQAHSCIPKDALPCSRCDTCLVLHFIKCSAFTDCKTMKHAVHILNNENEQKLWLRRTKLDFLLGSGSWV